MKTFAPCLWFDGQAEEAAKFYTSIFKNSEIIGTTHYKGESVKVSGRPEGSVLTVTFKLDGHDFMALNGGPEFKFTPAISLMWTCQTQEEIDYIWAKLTEGGQEIECGWLTDKFGVSWQIVPAMLGDIMLEDNEKSEKVMNALLKMVKLDIATLQRAYES